MNIQEYRKASAIEIGLAVYTMDSGRIEYADKDGRKIEWQPDIDANQREMIEDWLINPSGTHGLDIKFQFEQDSGGVWLAEFWRRGHPKDVYHSYEDESKSIAFMETFMQYIKTLNSLYYFAQKVNFFS